MQEQKAGKRFIVAAILLLHCTDNNRMCVFPSQMNQTKKVFKVCSYTIEPNRLLVQINILCVYAVCLLFESYNNRLIEALALIAYAFFSFSFSFSFFGAYFENEGVVVWRRIGKYIGLQTILSEQFKYVYPVEEKLPASCNSHFVSSSSPVCPLIRPVKQRKIIHEYAK